MLYLGFMTSLLKAIDGEHGGASPSPEGLRSRPLPGSRSSLWLHLPAHHCAGKYVGLSLFGGRWPVTRRVQRSDIAADSPLNIQLKHSFSSRQLERERAETGFRVYF